MGDRYNIHSQLEHLQSKYVGKFTGFSILRVEIFESVKNKKIVV